MVGAFEIFILDLNGQIPNCHSWSITWPILIQWIMVMIVRWKFHLVYTNESVLPVCDKPYHTNNRNVQKGEAIEVLPNYAFMR